MAHEAGHTGPYGELFELPTGTGDIDFESPTSQDLARIQQDPMAQIEYLLGLLEEGGAYSGDIEKWGGGIGETPTESRPYEALLDIMKRKSINPSTPEDFWENFGNLEGQELASAFGSIAEFGTDYGEDSPFYDEGAFLSLMKDLQEGFRKLQSGESSIGRLEEELQQLERGVTGPGGLTQQKGTFAEMLQQKIGTRRQEYVPQEKTSRYGKVTGTGGAVDPTQSYLSGVGSDVSAYETSITGVDKSIYDILYGTDAGSIHDIYGQYGGQVTGSLRDGDKLWYE